MIVRLTSRFHRDLHDIGDWVAQHDADAALRLTEALVEKAVGIADLPRGYAVVGRSGRSELRKRSYGDYVIIYRLGSEVEVLRVVHVRRDYLTFLDKL